MFSSEKIKIGQLRKFLHIEDNLVISDKLFVILSIEESKVKIAIGNRCYVQSQKTIEAISEVICDRD